MWNDESVLSEDERYHVVESLVGVSDVHRPPPAVSKDLRGSGTQRPVLGRELAFKRKDPFMERDEIGKRFSLGPAISPFDGDRVLLRGLVVPSDQPNDLGASFKQPNHGSRTLDQGGFGQYSTTPLPRARRKLTVRNRRLD
jgi:hypothetical protein